MPRPRPHTLCITLTPFGARLVEAKRTGGRAQVVKRSSFRLPAGAGIDQPAALGTALAEHLKQNGYSARNAVIGLCSRWVLARHKPVPPADADALRGIVGLQVERDFAGSSSEMSFDYLLSDEPVPADSRLPLLLAGANTKLLDQLRQAASAAGLKADLITPTALGAAAGRSGTVVLIEEGVASVMRVRRGAVLGLSACPADLSGLSTEDGRSRLLADLARCSMQLPSDDSGGGLTLLLPQDLDESAAHALANQAADRFGQVDALPADAAELLADAVLGPDAAFIDFGASRLTPPRKRRVSGPMAWAVRAAVLLLLVGGTFAYLWMDANKRLDDLQADYAAIADRAGELEQIRADSRAVESWYDKRPGALDCWLELTKTFPKNGNIRVTNMTFNSDLTGTIDCKAGDNDIMEAYFSQMRRSPHLVGVDRPSGITRGGLSDPTIEFSVSFRYVPAAEGDVQ